MDDSRKHINMKRKKKIKISVLLSLIFAVAVVLTTAGLMGTYTKLQDTQQELTDVRYELDSNKAVVYCAIRDIKAGEKLYAQSDVDGVRIQVEDVNIEQRESISSLAEDFFLTDEMRGMQALIDISQDTPVLASMVSSIEISTDLREYEVATAALMTDQLDDDYVDVRILFPDGSDYLVVSKKPVHDLNLEKCVFNTYLNEDEILRFSSAIIDAFTISGTYMYTTRYVESSIQEEAVPNYPVRSSTLAVMESDPNILSVAKETLNQQARLDLATRLSVLTEEHLEAVSEGFGLVDTANGSILGERLEEENEQDLEEEGETPEDASSVGIGEEIEEEEVTDGGL